MTHILVIWTIVGFAGTQFTTHKEHDWRPIGEFKSEQSCQAAGLVMSIKPANFRCLPK
jgi:hypothetical protein